MGDKPHKKLRAWQEAINLTQLVYSIAECFPKSEQYILSGQMKRAAISIASNIAEGSARNTDKEKLQFYIIARGSLSELDTQFEIAKKLGYIRSSQISIENSMDTVGRCLYGLIEKYRRTS